MQIDSFSVLSDFLCVICMCLAFCHNTTVKAESLRPSPFEKIAPHVKTNMFSHLGSLRLWFFYFYIFVDFRVPLPPPWARLVAFVAECGAIVGRFWQKLSKGGCLTKPRKSGAPGVKK